MQFSNLMTPRLLKLYEECITAKIPDRTFLLHMSNQLKNGTKILETETEVDAYLALYFGLHFCKLNCALSSINFQKLAVSNINLIDWGCGPATGTLAFINRFLGRVNIERIVLIEPSKVAVKRGKEYIEYILDPQIACSPAPITIVNQSFEGLSKSELAPVNSAINLHIFSNVLDIGFFDISKLCDLVRETQNGWNYFLCVSGVGNSSKESKHRITKFYHYFSHRFQTRTFVNFRVRPISTPPIYIAKYDVIKQNTLDMFNGFFSVNFQNVYSVNKIENAKVKNNLLKVHI